MTNSTPKTEDDKEKYFAYLDKIRLGEISHSSYSQRELLAHNFRMPIDRATKVLEEYNDTVGNRKQFLTE